MSNDNNEIKSEPVKQLQIICHCGCNVFEATKVHQLAPGDETGPVIVQGVKAWRCGGCGELFLPKDLPKKDDQLQPQQKKLLLPENQGKLRLLKH